DWNAALGTQPLRVTGADIMPSSIYEVREFGSGCMGQEAMCCAVSAPLTLKTQRMGDIVAPFQLPIFPATQPNVSDIAAVVDKFKDVYTSPIVACCDMTPLVPDFRVDITDIAFVVDGFRYGVIGYHYFPSTCP
ncbi:MAG: hypothetical protein HY287_01790, partial [Planctomycetes bacterium]|nr:hypothetical protein [Planctomycetota bacterium]